MGVACGADLQSVLDAAGDEVGACPPEQGCSGGLCVPACQAASDARTTAGCAYLVPTPHYFAGDAPPCHAVFLANDWSKPAAVTVEHQGQSFDVSQFGRVLDGTDDPSGWPPVPASGIPPGQVAVLFLSHDPTSFDLGPLTCPVPPAVSQAGGTAVSHYAGTGTGTGVGYAWSITTDVPVRAFDVLPFRAGSAAPSAALLHPTTAWGTNYLAVLPEDSAGPAWAQIVARDADTTVTLRSTTTLLGSGPLPGAGPGGVVSFVLGAGEFAQWEHDVGMTGSVLLSDKPIAFVGGSGFMCFSSATSSGGGCDPGHQQVPPISALGSEYVGAPYASRMPSGQPESVPYRLVGLVDGTLLDFDPPVPGAPSQIGAGEAALLEATGPFRVRSQDDAHPFHLSEMMTGCHVTGFVDCLGDEEHVSLVPSAQFLDRYVFVTDPTFPTTNLTLIRRKTAAGFQAVNVACLGDVGGWQDVGSSGEVQFAQVFLAKDGVPVGACAGGLQVASSDGPFGLVVWGLREAGSYGYPAGAGTAGLNAVSILPQ